MRFIAGKAEKILVELKENGYESKVLDAIKKEKLEDWSYCSSPFTQRSLLRLGTLMRNRDRPHLCEIQKAKKCEKRWS